MIKLLQITRGDCSPFQARSHVLKPKEQKGSQRNQPLSSAGSIKIYPILKIPWRRRHYPHPTLIVYVGVYCTPPFSQTKDLKWLARKITCTRTRHTKKVLERKKKTPPAGHEMVPGVTLIQNAGSETFTKGCKCGPALGAVDEKGKWVKISNLWGP